MNKLKIRLLDRLCEVSIAHGQVRFFRDWKDKYGNAKCFNILCSNPIWYWETTKKGELRRGYCVYCFELRCLKERLKPDRWFGFDKPLSNGKVKVVNIAKLIKRFKDLHEP